MRRRGFHKGHPSAVGRLVKESLDRLGLRGRVLEHQVIQAWSDVVGPQIAKCTVASDVRGGVLFVCCKSSMWCNELTLHKPRILSDLNAAVGKKVLTDIHFSARGFRQAVQQQASPKQADVSRVELAQDEVETADRIASSAGPQDLAERVRQAVLTSKRREALKDTESWVNCPRCSRSIRAGEDCDCRPGGER